MQVLVLICSYADMQRYEKHEKYMVISYVSTRQIVLFPYEVSFLGENEERNLLFMLALLMDLIHRYVGVSSPVLHG